MVYTLVHGICSPRVNVFPWAVLWNTLTLGLQMPCTDVTMLQLLLVNALY